MKALRSFVMWATEPQGAVATPAVIRGLLLFSVSLAAWGLLFSAIALAVRLAFRLFGAE